MSGVFQVAKKTKKLFNREKELSKIKFGKVTDSQLALYENEPDTTPVLNVNLEKAYVMRFHRIQKGVECAGFELVTQGRHYLVSIEKPVTRK